MSRIMSKCAWCKKEDHPMKMKIGFSWKDFCNMECANAYLESTNAKWRWVTDGDGYMPQTIGCVAEEPNNE